MWVIPTRTCTVSNWSVEKAIAQKPLPLAKRMVNYASTEQHQATHTDSGSPEAPIARLKFSYASTFSPDFASSDYHLFLFMSNDFAGGEMTTREDCENRLSKYLANRAKGFHERGIPINLKIAKSYRTKRCIFDISRIILTLVN